MTDRKQLIPVNGRRPTVARGGPVSRVDFAKFIPKKVSPERELAWLADQTRREADARREQRKVRLDRADDLELTDEMRDALIDELPLKPTPSLEDAKGWASGHPKPCLLLAGGTGCGKTLAAAWILANHGGIWLSAARAARLFSAKFGDQYEEQDVVRKCRLLFVDDLGTEGDGDTMTRVLIELLESRKSQRRRTVFSTNMTLAKFQKHYEHERLASRMSESVQWVASKHPDMRRQPLWRSIK